MSDNYQLERARVTKKIIEEMFRVRPGETVAITADTGSRKDIIDALAAAAYAVGGKPLVMWVPKARDNGQAGMPDWPVEALSAALSNVDVWIEAQSSYMLYSAIWEDVMRDNKKLRYVIITDSDVLSLHRVFGSVDVPMLTRLLERIKTMIMSTETIRVTSENGTDVTFRTDPNYVVEMGSGDYSKPQFGTAPGYVNVVPRFDTMEGTIMFDRVSPLVLAPGDRVGVIMKAGRMVDFIGTDIAGKLKSFVESFNDPNMYKISHMMVGLNPGVREISGQIVEDERVWGGVDFGFGHTSAIDAPPNGQPAKSHFDCVLEKVSIALDGTPIVENGTVCHSELKAAADALIGASNLEVV